VCGIWIGAKGTGKAWSLVKLLKHYEESSITDKKGRSHEMRTILVFFVLLEIVILIQYINS
jgi:hypothetical protein